MTLNHSGEQAQTIYNALVGDEHPLTSQGNYLLAKIYFHQHNQGECRKLLENCIKVQNKKVGSRHRFTAESFVYVAKNNTETGYNSYHILIITEYFLL
jgi:hypothetical protein